MITFRESHDPQEVDRLGRDPRIRPYMVHDGDPADVSFGALFASHPDTFFLEASYDRTPCGGFLFVDREVHTMLLPPLRGELAVEAGKKACDWLRENRGWGRMTSYCYSCHPQTLWFAKRVGFRRTETRDDGIAVNRKPVLTHVLEYTF